MKTKLFCISTLFFITFFIRAQECGTRVPAGFVQKYFVKAQQAPPVWYPQDTCLNRQLSVVFHIVLDSNNAPGVTPTDLSDCIDNLNKYFKPICLSFKSCSTNYVPNYNYNQWIDINHEPPMFANYYVDSTINIYLVDNIISPGGAAGYAAMPGGPDIIVMMKNALTNMTPIHEMGHFFGLLHTFDNTMGNELVPRGNCYTSGDGFCDTEADPYPIGNTPGVNCDFTYGPQDANGNYYTPPVDNIMTYFKACRCRFTQEQYNHMAYMFLTVRYYLH